mmetsp:Transcript_27929/g.61191  ORF Transcript_27929/g.61191 Transcript_27929/m.61191 type:complete len:204 (-) Transcript_27929:298-909(-)
MASCQKPCRPLPCPPPLPPQLPFECVYLSEKGRRLPLRVALRRGLYMRPTRGSHSTTRAFARNADHVTAQTKLGASRGHLPVGQDSVDKSTLCLHVLHRYPVACPACECLYSLSSILCPLSIGLYSFIFGASIVFSWRCSTSYLWPGYPHVLSRCVSVLDCSSKQTHRGDRSTSSAPFGGVCARQSYTLIEPLCCALLSWMPR